MESGPKQRTTEKATILRLIFNSLPRITLSFSKFHTVPLKTTLFQHTLFALFLPITVKTSKVGISIIRNAVFEDLQAL